MAILRNFAQRKGIGFPLLSDENSAVIRAFGILNEEAPKGSPFFGVPHPVTYIVNSSGIVQSGYFEEDFRKRFTIGAVLSEPDPRADVSAAGNERLRASASASDSVIRGGERVKLFVNVRLPRRMHIYAPGVESYIPVEWKMDSGLAEPLPVAWPQSRRMHLKAIDEMVPVYEHAATFIRDIVFTQSRELGKALDEERKIKIRGTLRFQACDDRQCFLPEEIPLVWTFQYEPPDSTRAPADLRRK